MSAQHVSAFFDANPSLAVESGANPLASFANMVGMECYSKTFQLTGSAADVYANKAGTGYICEHSVLGWRVTALEDIHQVFLKQNRQPGNRSR